MFNNTPCGSVTPNPILPSYASVRISLSRLEAEITLLPIIFCLMFNNTPCGSVTPNPILPSYASVRISRSKLDAEITLLPIIFCLMFNNTPCGSVTPNPILPSYANVRTSRSRLDASIILAFSFCNTENDVLFPYPSIYIFECTYKSVYKSKLYL